MGRELKRVPIDFDWPQKEIWKGYLRPDFPRCEECEHGQTHAGWALERLVGLIMMAGEAAVSGDIHPWLRDAGMGVSKVSEEMADLTAGLAGGPPSFMGYGCGERYRACRKIVEAAGLDYDDFVTCKACDGTGIANREDRGAAEAWEPEEPPSGDGFQLWETTSEGSPISPVFATLDELCEWCADNATTFGSATASAEQWRKMLDDGFVYHREGRVIFT